MTPELNSTSEFAPLPVRRRETLDIFDTALKLYRRYFWVLMGWSAIFAVCSLVPIISPFLFLFVAPLLYGAVSCCIAAAVRGQTVRFGQCWQFTKPRYGALLGVIFLGSIVCVGIFLGLYIAGILLFLLGAFVLSNAPEPIQIVGGIVGAIAFIIALSGVGAMAIGWLTMAPIVACLEDDKRGTASMGRSLDLLKGNWRRVFGLSLILGLAVVAMMGIVAGLYMFFDSGSMSLGLTYTLGGFMCLFYIVWNPAQFLVVAVLYLDLRVRREALDLEWTAYASTPPSVGAPQNGVAAAPAPGQLPPDRLQPLQTPASEMPSGVSSFAQDAVRPPLEPNAAPSETSSPVELTTPAEPTLLPGFEPAFAPPHSIFDAPVIEPPVVAAPEATPVVAASDSFEASFAAEFPPVETPSVETPPMAIPVVAKDTETTQSEVAPTSFAPTSFAPTSFAPAPPPASVPETVVPIPPAPAPAVTSSFAPSSFAPAVPPVVPIDESREGDGSSR